MSTAAEALAAAFGLASLDEDERFTPSTAFNGVKSGWVFKSGTNGLGYYVDEPLHEGSGGRLMFVPALAFAGKCEGFVFKRGEEGMGYYRDSGGSRPPEACIKSSMGSSCGSGGSRGGSGCGGASLRSGRGTASSTSMRSNPRGGFQFGGDNRGRAFRAFCEAAVARGIWSSARVDAVYNELEALPDGIREDQMMKVLEEGLRGREVSVVGATGRTSRGWWGDGSTSALRVG